MWKFLPSLVLYTNSKYVSYVWTVLCLCILISSNISEIYMTAYFGYFSDILHVVHNHSPSTPYLLTRWPKQIYRLVDVIWVEYPKVPFQLRLWVMCLDCVMCLRSFWCYILALNCILFGWTICLPVYCLIEPFL